MSQWITRNTRDGRITLGRRGAEKLSAIEGQSHTARTSRIIREADAKGESGEALRARIRAEFAKK